MTTQHVSKVDLKFPARRYGIVILERWCRGSPGNGPMDLVTISDFAYIVAMIENKKKVWEQQAMMKGMLPEEKKRLKESGDYCRQYVEEEPKFTSRGGRKYEYLGCGWNKEGKMFYYTVWREWTERFKKQEFWDMMEVAYEMHKSENEEVNMWQKKVSFSFQCCKENKPLDNAHLLVGGMTGTQANNKRIANDEEEENEFEDECSGKFLLPGDKGFEGDRPIKRSKVMSENEDQEEETCNQSKEGNFLSVKEVGSKEGNLWSAKEVGRYCKDVANHDESESEGDLQTPKRKKKMS